MTGAVDTSPGETPASSSRRATWLRLGVLFALVATTLIVARALGLHERFTVDGIRAEVLEAGALGMLALVALFVVGQLLYVPNILFVVAATLVYGAPLGGVVSVAGATAAVTVNFLFVRAVGGQPLAEARSRVFRLARRHLERHPLLTVIALRLFFLTSPPLTAALALSPVGFRQHLSASFIGMTPHALIAAFVIELFA